MIKKLERRLKVITRLLNKARETVNRLERLRAVTVMRIDEIIDAEDQARYDKAQRAGVKSRISTLLEMSIAD